MHNALYIDELVRSIVYHCEDQTSDLERRRTLFRLGSTSKIFLDAALDSLWSRLPSMTPLLKLIPGVSVLDGVYVGYFIVFPKIELTLAPDRRTRDDICSEHADLRALRSSSEGDIPAHPLSYRCEAPRVLTMFHG
jgi:hypothetical protein